jgi:hypothetical protein
VERLINRRKQGDLGELSAMEWLTSNGATVFAPFGHSPDIDLIAELDGRLLRVQVKTSVCGERTALGYHRYSVNLATNGGNQSWTGTVKKFDPERIDFLFVLTGDGRRWFIPSRYVEARRCVRIGGPKYSEFEIERGRAIRDLVYGPNAAPLESDPRLGECPSGQRDGAVNATAQPSQVRILPPPSQLESTAEQPSDESLGRSGQTAVWGKRRITIPLHTFQDAGLQLGDRLRVTPGGAGRLLLERIESEHEKLTLLDAG